jgi:mercuric ion transport protein
MSAIGEKSSSAVLSYFSLFTSLGTLLCCALPSLLVLAGLGASVASLLSAAPWLVSLSRHKPWTFGISGTLIAASFVNLYYIGPRLRKRACSPGNPDTCDVTSRFSKVLL